jgi:hypothetical protein
VQKAFWLALMMEDTAEIAVLPTADKSDMRQAADYDELEATGVIADAAEW